MQSPLAVLLVQYCWDTVCICCVLYSILWQGEGVWKMAPLLRWPLYVTLMREKRSGPLPPPLLSPSFLAASTPAPPPLCPPAPPASDCRAAPPAPDGLQGCWRKCFLEGGTLISKRHKWSPRWTRVLPYTSDRFHWAFHCGGPLIILHFTLTEQESLRFIPLAE